MLSTEELLIRLGVAALLGSIVGLERERHDWVAGLRTHMLVCVGSALIVIVSTYGFFDVLSTDKVVLDPSRVAAQVVSGIGFLGAGTILYLRHNVIRGLTTAAGLWTVAGIGLAIGSGLFEAGIITTVITVVILALVKPLERFFVLKGKKKEFTIVMKRGASFDLIDQTFTELGLKIVRLDIHQSEKAERNKVDVILAKGVRKKEWPKLLDKLKAVEGVLEINYQLNHTK